MQSHNCNKRRTIDLIAFLLILLLGVFILQFGDRAVDAPYQENTALESSPESSISGHS